MMLHRRLTRLEGNRPPASAPLALDLPPYLVQRVKAAQSAGTFPQSLCDDDLAALMAAMNETERALT